MAEVILTPAEILQKKLERENNSLMEENSTLQSQLVLLNKKINEKDSILVDKKKEESSIDIFLTEKRDKVKKIKQLEKLLLEEVKTIEGKLELKKTEDKNTEERINKLKIESKKFSEERAEKAKARDMVLKEIENADKKLQSLMSEIDDVEEFNNKKEFYKTLTETLSKIVDDNKEILE